MNSKAKRQSYFDRRDMVMADGDDVADDKGEDAAAEFERWGRHIISSLQKQNQNIKKRKYVISNTKQGDFEQNDWH